MKKLYFSALFAVVFLLSLPMRAQDVVSITFEVNDSTLGSIYPAPGTYSFTVGDTFSIVATAAEGYKILGWVIVGNHDGESFSHPLDTAVTTLTATADVIEGCSSYSVVAVFETVAIYPDSSTFVVGVNDPDMGAILPISGTFHYAIGDEIYFVAEPYGGYEFIGWHSTVVYPTVGVVQYEEMLLPYNTIGPFFVDGDLLGTLSRLIALFAPVEDVEKVEAQVFNAYGKDGHIFLNGAEGREVYLFDIHGRMIQYCPNASASETFAVPVKGAYLLKVVGLGSKTVLLAR